MKHVTTPPLTRLTHGVAAAARIAPAGIVVAALVVAGRGGSASDAVGAGGESSAGGEQLTTVKVGVLPIGTQVPIYLGIEQGFFRQKGLELETQVMTGGSAVVPAVLQGGVQFGFANGATIVFGAEKGLPIKVVAGIRGVPDVEAMMFGDGGAR
jgi:NitT/TauT family transport system substrate-binding protein